LKLHTKRINFEAGRNSDSLMEFFNCFKFAALQLAAESKGEGARLKQSVRSTETP